MERTKLYKLIIAVLVIINVGILVFFYAGRPPHGRHIPGNLAEHLGIEDEIKQKKITQLEKKHHAKKMELINIDHKLHEELFSTLGKEEDVSAIHLKIMNNFDEIEKETFFFFDEVSKLCTPEQVEKLKEQIYHAFNQMGPHPKK